MSNDAYLGNPNLKKVNTPVEFTKDEIFHMKHDPKGLIDFTFREKVSERAQYFLAVVMLMARCKYVITSAANVDIWISLFRGHADNVTQYYKNEWSHS